MKNENRRLNTVEVLSRLQADMPEVWELAEVVGRWVWVEFDAKPDANTRAGLKALGFRWNQKRGCWQHACGHFRRFASRNDPRFSYGSIKVSAAVSEREPANV